MPGKKGVAHSSSKTFCLQMLPRLRNHNQSTTSARVKVSNIYSSMNWFTLRAPFPLRLQVDLSLRKCSVPHQATCRYCLDPVAALRTFQCELCGPEYVAVSIPISRPLMTTSLWYLIFQMSAFPKSTVSKKLSQQSRCIPFKVLLVDNGLLW